MYRFLLYFFALFLPLLGCSTDSGSDEITVYNGVITTTDNQPVANAQVTLFETGESVTTDDFGEFSLESFKHFSSVGFFIQTDIFTNTARIDEIPDSALTIQVTLSYDPSSNNLSITSTQFGDEVPVDPTPAPPPVPTIPGMTETPSPSPTRHATPTSKPTSRPGNLDENGNTTKFGIPSGLVGNINQGRGVWASVCSECHSREKSNRTYNDIERALHSIPDMRNVRVSNASVADVTAYLNRGRR